MNRIAAMGAISLLVGALLAPASADTSTRRGGVMMTQPDAIATTATGRKIDKSCIMMCDRWGERGCDKWVMRCKGDPGYPKGLLLSQ